MTELEAALAYAAAGMPVFPCNPDSKQPLITSDVKGEGGLKLATLQEARIRQWWQTWPAAMVAMRTGSKESGGAGIFVIDIDPPEGKTAEVVLAELVNYLAELRAQSAEGNVVEFVRTLDSARTYSLPDCPLVRTPRGGLHLWFATPPEISIRNRANVLKVRAPGIDVRGDDGYVIVPPSVRRGPRAVQERCDGVAYQFELSPLGAPVPPAPAELLRLVLEKHDEPKRTRGGATTADAIGDSSARSEAQRRYALSALDYELASVRGAKKGHRNHTLNAAALSLGKLIPHGLLIETAVRDLLFQAAEACGLVKDDGAKAAEDTIDSGLRAGMATPRDLSDVGRLAGRGSKRPPPPDDSDRPMTPQPLLQKSQPDFGEARGEDDEPPPPSGPPGGEGGSGEGDGEGEGIDPEKLARAMEERCNDSGNAARLRIWFGEDFLNVEVAEQLNSAVGIHVFDGKRWNDLEGGRNVQNFAKKVAELIQAEANALQMTEVELTACREWGKATAEYKELLRVKEAGEDFDVERFAVLDQLAKDAQAARRALGSRRGQRRKFALSSGNAGRLANMIWWALPDCTFQPEAMDIDPLAINCRNGTLRAVRDEKGAWSFRLDPHDRADKITKLMEVDYDPEARAPLFEAFIERFQPGRERREFLQLWHGLGLTALTEQAFVLNYGTGANGKTTFIEALARLHGDYAQTLPAEALVGDQQRRGDQATPELARLRGARLVRCAELPRGQNFRESTIKMLTGGDMIPVRQLHGKFWDLKPVFKAVGFCNEKPDISGVDEGIWRRVMLVDWKVTIPVEERRPINDVLAEFDQERAGILNWLLAGLKRYLDNGFYVPEEIREATLAYREDNDPVGSFINACVHHGKAKAELVEGKNVSARVMYNAYQAYCHANSVRVFTQKSFAQILTQKGFVRRRAHLVEYLDCILHDVPDDPDLQNRFHGRASDHVEFHDQRAGAYQQVVDNVPPSQSP